MTASTSSEAIRLCEESCTVAPMRSATALALVGLTSVTATTRPPAITVWMRSMWAWPIPPGPIIPMRTVMVSSPLLQAEAEGREVLAGLDGGGQGVVLRAAVHVLLAHDVQLLVEVGEGLDELTHVRQSGWGSDGDP